MAIVLFENSNSPLSLRLGENSMVIDNSVATSDVLISDLMF